MYLLLSLKYLMLKRGHKNLTGRINGYTHPVRFTFTLHNTLISVTLVRVIIGVLHTYIHTHL